MIENIAIYTVISLVALYLIQRVFTRLLLSRAKHPSLRGHSKWSRRISRLIPYVEYNETQFFCSDGAPQTVVELRKNSIEKLTNQHKISAEKTIAFSQSLDQSISDVHFTSAYRVPFPYRKQLDNTFKNVSIVEESAGVKIKNIDGDWHYDLFGSYGVNVFGYDFYKECMAKGFEKVKQLGPVLGPYHPVIRDNVERLKVISGLDEVSFHMSGTEAVMQAVRLARYHTGKTHLVRLCGAYHGWWDGVQPGVGNQRKTNDIYTLSDQSELTLKVLKTRHDIACVLINPLQALHPNSDASSDASLINSTRKAKFHKAEYSRWLQRIRQVCHERNIVLIFDEVFTGFRLAHKGAQAYFDVQADIVTYGKTLGGGLPVGVVCGKSHLMKRFKDDQPVNISFARGTFNSHPVVMATMNEFLCLIEQTDIQHVYQQADTLWNERVAQLNNALSDKSLPVRIENIHSILTVLFTQPSRYNWMLQFYLRAQGLELSWVGSGRLIMSLNYSDDDFLEVQQRFVAAAEAMEQGGWWWYTPALTNKSIQQQLLQDMLAMKFPRLIKYYQGITRKPVATTYVNESINKGEY